MLVSRKADYAMRALIALREAPGGKLTSRQISDQFDIPYKFLTQVLLSLARSGIVRSERGAGGGIILQMKPVDVSLRLIVEAVDGPIQLLSCRADTEDDCLRPIGCPILSQFSEVEERLVSILDGSTLNDLRFPDDIVIGSTTSRKEERS